MNAPIAAARPSLDFQTHLAVLEANGLLQRVDQPINKDTNCIPLYAGISWEEFRKQRRAFLFT